MASDAPLNKETKELLEEPITSIRIFTYPKVIFLWPTMVAAFLCGIGMLLVGDLVTVRDLDELRQTGQASAVQLPPRDFQDDSVKAATSTEVPEGVARGEVSAQGTTVKNFFTTWQNSLGLFFLLIFAMNLIVMSLDFPRFTIVAAFFLITTLVFLLLYLANQGVPVLTPFKWLSRHIYAVANAGFYFTIGTLILVMLIVIAATRYLDYWEISNNEILHHHGPLSDLERFPTINLKFSKEIPDILEYLLGLGAGRLTLSFGLDNRSVTLDHVLFISKKEVALKKMMGQLSVRVEDKR